MIKTMIDFDAIYAMVNAANELDKADKDADAKKVLIDLANDLLQNFGQDKS